MNPTGNSKEPFALRDDTGFIKELHPVRIYLLSIFIGAVSALATIGFIKLYLWVRKLVYFSNTSNVASIAHELPRYAMFAYFILGGLTVGLIVYYVIPLHGRGHGLPHLLYNFRKLKPISYLEGIGSTIASIFSLALGASVGREAPMMFLGGSLSSWFCHLFKLEGHYFRLLMACAVGTALATSLHSNFVALFFILEVVSFSLTAIDLIPISLSVFTGSIIRELFLTFSLLFFGNTLSQLLPINSSTLLFWV